MGKRIFRVELFVLSSFTLSHFIRYIAGFFFETTVVKRINEEEFVPISSCEEFKHCDFSSSIVSTDLYSMV